MPVWYVVWCVCVVYTCMCCVCACVVRGVVCGVSFSPGPITTLTLSPSTLREGKGRKQACPSPVTTDHKAQGVNKPALSGLEPGSQGPSVASPRPSEGSGELRVRRSGRALAPRASVQPRLHPPTALLPVGVAPPHLSFSQLSVRTSAPASGPILPQRDHILT